MADPLMGLPNGHYWALKDGEPDEVILVEGNYVWFHREERPYSPGQVYSWGYKLQPLPNRIPEQ